MTKERKSQSYGDTLEEWKLITEAYDSNQEDLPHLEAPKNQLKALLEQAKDTIEQQAAFAAKRQEMTHRLADALDQGRKLATFLRLAIKQRYGNRSEKLVEFGVQPLRRRRPGVSTHRPPGPEAPEADPTARS